MEIKTHLNHLHIAPRKVRLVADLIRGKDTRRAEMMLRELPKRASAPLLKLLRSALADARHNFQAASTDFYVKEIRVDPGPVSKRTRARAFGRAAAIRKRTSHVSLFLDTREATSTLSMATKERSEPMVRDMTPEDKVRGAAGRQGRREKSSAPKTLNPKASGAIRRMFQRKAI